MKTLLVAVFLGGTVSLCAGETATVALGKSAEALKQAHNMHDTAIRACSLKPEHEIGWDYMESQAKELADAHDLPAASKTVDVLGALRTERRALMRDFAGCAFKLGQTQTAVSVLNAMDLLDDAANDLEANIRDRAWNMEKGLDYCKNHLAN